jgi:RNA polymerase sigma factor (sigma-70 family)
LKSTEAQASRFHPLLRERGKRITKKNLSQNLIQLARNGRPGNFDSFMEPGRVSNSSGIANRSQFTETDWSAVLLAGTRPTPEGNRALETLCQRYWQPIYAFLRYTGRSPQDAEDLCQDLFASLIQRNSLASADPGKGRFRTFLLGALKHLLSDHAAAAQAQKRGGGWKAIVIDSNEGDGAFQLASTAPSPEAAFDRSWGLRLLENGIHRLRREFADAGKLGHFEAFKPFLTEPPGKGDYSSAAQALGMTPGAVTISVHRMRERYRELVREEAVQTLARVGDVDEELRALFG